MAKSKKKPARASKPTQAKASPAKASSAKPVKQSEAQRLLASLPRITDVQRAAFASQHDDAVCDRLGTKTQSAAVSKDAVAFAHTIDAALKKQGPALRRYAPARFAFFLECIVALDRARDEQESGKNDAAPARRSLDQARARATEARRDLHHALDLLIGDQDIDRSELDRAAGTAKSDDALVSSLNDLARLADAWLRRPDGESRALVASVDLQRGDVDEAWAIATELEGASDRASGKRVSYAGHDTPSVNRAEGRVLLEMRHAMRAFGHAADANKLVPRLSPGAGTRAVLASHPHAKSDSKNGAVAAPPN